MDPELTNFELKKRQDKIRKDKPTHTQFNHSTSLYFATTYYNLFL